MADLNDLLHTLLINETNSYFNNLQSLPLTHSEYISLINTVLIPTLQYRLLAHNIHITQLHSIQSLIWRRLCQLGHLSSVTSPKDIYQRRPLGGLGLKHFLYAYHVQNVNQATRFLSGEGPASSLPLALRCVAHIHTHTVQRYMGRPNRQPKAVAVEVTAVLEHHIPPWFSGPWHFNHYDITTQ